MLSEIGDYEGTKRKIENSYKIRDHFKVRHSTFRNLTIEMQGKSPLGKSQHEICLFNFFGNY